MKGKVIKMTKEEYLQHFKYYTESHFIPEHTIRDYLEILLGGKIVIETYNEAPIKIDGGKLVIGE